MTDVNNATESSAVAVVEPKFDPSDQHTWSPVQREAWNQTGDVPEPPKKQDSAPAPTPEIKAKPEPEGKSAAESGAAPKQEKKGKQTAEERIQELIGERNAFEERLRKLEAAPQPSSKTEPAKAVEAPKRPNPFKWTGTPEEFEAAQDAWEQHLSAKAVWQAQQQQLQQQTASAMQQQLKQATEKYPDAEPKIQQATAEILSKAPDFVKRVINDSEVVGDLLYVLSDPKTLNNLLETARTNPTKAVMELAKMQLRIQGELKDPEVAKAPPKAAEPEKKSPAPPEPRAPKPPSEVGGRGTSSEDALVTAARANDFRSFEAEQRRRILAK